MIRCDTRLDSPESVIQIKLTIFDEKPFKANALCDLTCVKESNTSYVEVMVV